MTALTELGIYLVGLFICVIIGCIKARMSNNNDFITGGFICGILWPLIGLIGVLASIVIGVPYLIAMGIVATYRRCKRAKVAALHRRSGNEIGLYSSDEHGQEKIAGSWMKDSD